MTFDRFRRYVHERIPNAENETTRRAYDDIHDYADALAYDDALAVIARAHAIRDARRVRAGPPRAAPLGILERRANGD